MNVSERAKKIVAAFTSAACSWMTGCCSMHHDSHSSSGKSSTVDRTIPVPFPRWFTKI